LNKQQKKIKMDLQYGLNTFALGNFNNTNEQNKNLNKNNGKQQQATFVVVRQQCL